MRVSFLPDWRRAQAALTAFADNRQQEAASVSPLSLAQTFRNPGAGARREETVVNQKQLRAMLAHPTPELPVEDVERAQQHYRDALGFEIGWLSPGGDIGAVLRDDVAIFFRRRGRPFEPAVHWVFAVDIDATYEELRSRGARIVEPLATKPWGLRQFTLEDIDGNRFYFHCD
jgi:predicted enzyme related to lactoylglutathione lyase